MKNNTLYSLVIGIVVSFYIVFFSYSSHALFLKLLIGLSIFPSLFLLPDVYTNRQDGKQNQLLLFVVLLLQLIGIFMPTFMSDDVFRHIHDGYYLLRGIDVYSTPPINLPRIAQVEALPNHPHLGSIYLPSTQLLAMLGSFLHVRYGFIIIFHSLCALFIYLICKEDGRKKDLLLPILLSPWLIFSMSGHHADYLGMLMVLFIFNGLSKYHRDAQKSKYFALFFGMIVVFLPSLKPEGLFCSIYFLFHFFLKYHKRGKQTQQTTLFTWMFGGALAMAFVLVVTAFLFMWPNVESFMAFLGVARLFSQSFLAYNPFPHLLVFLSGCNQQDGIFYSRLAIVSILFMVVLLRIDRKTKSPTSGTLSKIARGRSLFYRSKVVLAGVVLMSILHKGTWNPWYFLWLLPIVLEYKYIFRSYWYLSSGMVLFYIPIVDYRLHKLWDMTDFYMAMFLYLILVMGRTFILKRRGQNSFL